ncbi:dTDP-4-dehydrorhamnose reductase family protein [Vibrio cholerae]|uniref:dTDP-4-dehydrorhamnose reductase family protein n=1 Tax=Vibrio cholerae TaxID=666 RepID=UPI001AE0FB13|nr:SDR family oxidoreductase [Vibrio cholerae]EGR0545269.1 SDR family oxidoreductase [Vibrio cholerae]EGR0573187.1 SDR family oxidoreductase [Vibrio cholerae]EGR5459336.1 SDR family oxidoreductase [Vibrio cholerae]ELN3182548.1 SDR family oxidoreductase [Vibrio cholerae]MBP0923807.1 SDR family oxidoreductase [Vibrio cholerae]
MKVLVIGASGMLGYSLFSNLSEKKNLNVFGTVRANQLNEHFQGYETSIFTGIDVDDFSTIESVIKSLKPQFVLNCVGLIKQHDVAKNHVAAISINSLLPHKLAAICDMVSAKLIHFSTDCVFTGKQGMYTEETAPDSVDLYGLSKKLGEVEYGNHLTLRTSIIGHELNSNLSLIDWFLSQEGQVKGFTKAIFSGLPTSYIAQLLSEKIFDSDINGLYHLSVAPIDKYTLLKLVSNTYKKDIVINADDTLNIDRSLDSTKLRTEIDFTPPSWEELVDYMHTDFVKRYKK